MGLTDNNHMPAMLKSNRCGSGGGIHSCGSRLQWRSAVATPVKHICKKAPMRPTHEHHGMSSAKNLAGTLMHNLQRSQHIRLLCEPSWWLHLADHMRSLPGHTPGVAQCADAWSRSSLRQVVRQVVGAADRKCAARLKPSHAASVELERFPPPTHPPTRPLTESIQPAD